MCIQVKLYRIIIPKSSGLPLQIQVLENRAQPFAHAHTQLGLDNMETVALTLVDRFVRTLALQLDDPPSLLPECAANCAERLNPTVPLNITVRATQRFCPTQWYIFAGSL